MSKIIKSSVYLRNLYLKKIPDIFQGVEVRGDFWCYCNQLTSLKGAPEHVGGDFHCYNNAVKFTEEQVRAVCNVKGKVYV